MKGKQLNNVLANIFNHVDIITFGEVEDTLLINELHLTPRTFGTSVNAMLKFIKEIDIKSITILKGVRSEELEKFLELAGKTSSQKKITAAEWDNLLEQEAISNIIIHLVLFTI